MELNTAIMHIERALEPVKEAGGPLVLIDVPAVERILEELQKQAQLEKKLKEYMGTLSEVDPVSAAALARRWRNS